MALLLSTRPGDTRPGGARRSGVRSAGGVVRPRGTRAHDPSRLGSIWCGGSAIARRGRVSSTPPSHPTPDLPAPVSLAPPVVRPDTLAVHGSRRAYQPLSVVEQAAGLLEAGVG